MKAVGFLKEEAAARLADCLDDFARDFPLALDLGAHGGELARHISGKSRAICCDLAENLRPDVVCDEEFLPFAPDTFDLVVSALSLQHVNDLPGCLAQIRAILKADGLFAAILPGAGTLIELRRAFAGAAAQHDQPLYPRVSPFVEVRDAGALMQRAGFALPVIHSELVTVHYPDALSLMRELKQMGESNILLEQCEGLTPASHIASACDYYDRNFRAAEGGVTATFEFITMTGWKPHPSQQQSLRRGSAKASLADGLK